MSWNSESTPHGYSARNLDLGCSLGAGVSVKIIEKNLFAEAAEIVYVQAAGISLASIETSQLVPLRRDCLLRLLKQPDQHAPRGRAGPGDLRRGRSLFRNPTSP